MESVSRVDESLKVHWLQNRLTNAPGQGCRLLEPCSCSQWVAGDVVHDSQARVRCCVLPQVQLDESRFCQPDSSLRQLQITHNHLSMLECWRPTQVVTGSGQCSVGRLNESRHTADVS